MVKGLEAFIKDNNIRTHNGKLVLYKAVSKEWGSLWVRMKRLSEVAAPSSSFTFPELHSPGLSDVYLPGTTVRIRKYDSDPYERCGRGLHVATLAYAIDFLDRDFFSTADAQRRLIQVLVDPEDVVAVPPWSKKIRCRRLIVVGEVTKKGNPKRK